MEMLKLVALDEEDLQVLSAHLQDAVLKVSDLQYLGNEALRSHGKPLCLGRKQAEVPAQAAISTQAYRSALQPCDRSQGSRH